MSTTRSYQLKKSDISLYFKTNLTLYHPSVYFAQYKLIEKIKNNIQINSGHVVNEKFTPRSTTATNDDAKANCGRRGR